MTSAGGAGSIALTSKGMGIDDTTWVHGYSTVVPSARTASTAVALPSPCLILTTLVRISTELPLSVTSSVQRSHIIPGPNLGYWNSSISEVMSFWLRLGST